ncbi:MAG: hypothetical protein KA941_12540 [Flavobacteriales bacterium]|nr:hypothetical protein [Flavobacteriales bacterium]
MVRIALAFTLVALFTSMVSAQELITIRGRVGSVDNERAHYDLMIVNKRTRTGTFGNADGSFVVQALRTDTLMIGSSGYRTAIITMADSAAKPSYEVYVRLMRVVRQLPELQVINERTLAEIQKEISKLGYREQDYRISNVDALQSPITFLYQEFSRRERSKRLAAQLRNEDRKRELLRELLKKYVEFEIINLSDDAFDDFIDFCAVPEEVIKGLSQYDFLMYVKKKYELYSSLGPTRRH